MRNDTRSAAGNLAALQALAVRTLAEERSGASLSGKERNRLFRGTGSGFEDISGVSGLDDPADGRGFAILDYDRDGRLDIALVNANAPWVELFHNQIGCQEGEPAVGRMIALRFVGGNDRAAPSAEWSARDGYGATVTLDLGDGRRLSREHRAGEGFAAQNSATMLIGIGDRETVPALTVRWPSGREQTATDVRAGTLTVVHENPAQAADGRAFVSQAYRTPLPESSAGAKARRPGPKLRLTHPDSGRTQGELRVYTTMATWCAACKGELPQFERLRDAFPGATLTLFAIPVDLAESREQIAAWGAAHQPVYDLLLDLPAAEVEGVRDLVREQLGLEAVPATLVTDGAGNLLLARWGPPSISDLRRLLPSRRQETADRERCQP